MKTGEVADRLGVSPQTVRNWKDEWIEFLSPSLADTQQGVPMMFSARDVRVLATVAHCKEQQFSAEEIREVLKNDENLVEVPPKPSPAEKAAEAGVQLIPLSEYRREIKTLTDERDDLRDRLDDTLEEVKALREEVGLLKGQLKRQSSEDEKEKQLHDEIVKLNREIARMEVLLELEQEKAAEEKDDENK